MRKIQRRAIVGALAGLTLFAGAACGGGGGGGGGQPAEQPRSPAQESQSPAAQQRVTTAKDVYGPGCAQVPTQGEGSVQGMIDDPVATAASNNPLLTTLVQAVQAAGLVDTLNDPNASYTVFAPANSAFEALPPGTLDQLLANPDQLRSILTYHVVPQRYDAEDLASADTVPTVNGAQVTIQGEGQNISPNGAPVLCGNVPTGNATVFVIGEVLMPPA